MLTDTDPRLCGFTPAASGGHSYTRTRDGTLAIVQTFDDAWGYTLWEGDRCVGGAKDWENWTLHDACEAAGKALAGEGS